MTVSTDIILPGVNTTGTQNTSGSAFHSSRSDILTTARTIGGVSFNGSTNIDLPGVNTAGNQNTSGKATTAGTADKATKLNTTTNGIVKTSGGDGTLSIGTLSSVDIPDNAADTSGKATTAGTADKATILATARTIGGVSFNGSANIDLPGVNTAGNQNTSGKATTAGTADKATILATARTIGGVSFNGAANIDLPGVNTAGNQNTSGKATTAGTADKATILATARTIGGVSFNGSANIDLPGVNTAGNQNTTGNAKTVTNGVYRTDSATVLSDIVTVGSGNIITDEERTKLLYNTGFWTKQPETKTLITVKPSTGLALSLNDGMIKMPSQKPVLIGYEAGLYPNNDGKYSVAIGERAGYGLNQECIAIGFAAGEDGYEHMGNVSIGHEANRIASVISGGHYGNVAVGYRAGRGGMDGHSIAIGVYSGYNGVGQSSVFIGSSAGWSGGLYGTVAIGYFVGKMNSSSTHSVLIGRQAGQGSSGNSNKHGTDVIAIGRKAAYSSADDDIIGIGSITIGSEAGEQGGVGNYSISIGYRAGQTYGPGAYNIFIGAYAANKRYGCTNSIVLNATGSEFNPIDGQNSSFYVKPIRNASANYGLFYNNTTGEITYNTASEYSLPTAASNTLGGIKVGANLTITDGVLAGTPDTNTTYSVGDGELTQKNFTTTLYNKLNGITASANNYSLPTAASNTLGGIKVGANLTITDGVLAGTPDTNTTYSVGDGELTQKNFTTTLYNKLNGITASANNYSLPTAASNTLGGIKVGANLTMTDGVLSAVGGSSLWEAYGGSQIIPSTEKKSSFELY